MTGRRQDGIPLAEAALALGLSADAVRKRLARGTLAGYKRGRAWYVVLPPPDAPPDARPDATGRQEDGNSGVIHPTVPGVTPAEVERAIARTGQQYTADLGAMFAQVAALYDQRLADKDALIAELRRRAEAAEAALSSVEPKRDTVSGENRQIAEPHSVEQKMPTPAPPVAPAPAGGLWARLRRALGRG